MVKEKKKIVIIGIIIFIVCLMVSILNGAGVVVGLANTFSLYSILVLGSMPYFSIVQLFLSQILLIINDTLHGYSIKDAIDNTGVIEVYSWFALIILYMIIYKKCDDKSFRGVLFYKRRIKGIPAWSRFMIYCIVITMIFTVANDSQLDIYRDRVLLRILAGGAAVLPSITILARYTTTSIAYDLLIFTSIFKLITIINLGIQGELDIVTIIYYIIEIVIIVSSIYKDFRGEDD